MARILLVYGTRQGHTAHIAEDMADTLRSEGHDVDVRNLVRDSVPPIREYDAVIVGASVHARGYEREVRRWVGAHADELASVASAFFSVSLTSANRDTESNVEIDAVIDHFIDKAGWQPQLVGRFGGAVAYSQYNWLLKHFMRRIVRHESGDAYLDMSRDYDLTDYEEVTQFAKMSGDLARVAEFTSARRPAFEAVSTPG